MTRRTVFVGLAASAAAMVVTPTAAGDSAANLPDQLRKYVAGTPEFAAASWMSSSGCLGRGGDVSAWVTSVLADTPMLLAHTQPSTFGKGAPAEDVPRSKAIVAGYRQIATELGPTVPAGFCADELARWTGTETTATPLSVPWGAPSSGGHQTDFSCFEQDDPAIAAREKQHDAGRARLLGAERVPCDGVYVACANAPEAEKSRCETWNTWSDDYVRRVNTMRYDAINANPATGVGVVRTAGAQPAQQPIAAWVTAGGAVLLAAAGLWRLRGRGIRQNAATDGDQREDR